MDGEGGEEEEEAAGLMGNSEQEAICQYVVGQQGAPYMGLGKRQFPSTCSSGSKRKAVPSEQRKNRNRLIHEKRRFGGVNVKIGHRLTQLRETDEKTGIMK